MERAERLGKYELLRHLASGGMARVFLARVDGVGGFTRHLVLKTVRPERTEDSSYVSMFLDEARLIATLHHQHVAQVYDVGVAEDGTYFLAMEYLHGETVRAILERARDLRERLPLDFSLTIVAAAAAGLHHAHERRGPDGRRLGIVHRDVTPSNVIAGYDGSVKLIDFGIAKAAERSHQTKTGFIKGKAGYMAPEQALGQPVDRRADVFSLGVVLYELTTQTRAFPASSELEVAHRIVRGEVTPPSMAVQGYPIELEDVIMTALARDPDERFGDAEAFGYALDQAAHQLGVNTGPAAVSRVMAQLFGTRPEPWLVPQTDEPDEHESMTGDTASLLDARPLRVTSGTTSGPSTSAVGFARGTGAQDDPSPRRARGTTNQPPVAARPRTESQSLPRPRTQSDAPPLRPDPPPLSKRAPTVPMRAQTPPALAAGSNDVTLDEDSDAEMPTVKFLSLDEAEIIIEQPGKGARVVAPPPGTGKKMTPLPGVPPIVPEASPLPVAAEPAGPVRSLDSGSALARDQRVESAPVGPVPAVTMKSAPAPMPALAPMPAPAPTPAPAPAPVSLIPAPPVLPAVAAVAPRPPPSKVGSRTEPVTALDRVLESQAHRARHRRWILPLAGGAVLAVAVAAIGFVMLGGDDDAADSAPPAALTQPAPPPPAPPPPPPAKPAETSTIHVRITTTPSDATVLLDGERLGRTPLDIERPRKAGPVVLKVRRKGYSTKKLDVDLNADVVFDFKLNKSDKED